MAMARFPGGGGIKLFLLVPDQFAKFPTGVVV